MAASDVSMWSRTKLALVVLATGAGLARLTNRLLPENASDLTVSLVRNFLPVTVISCVVLVVGNLRQFGVTGQSEPERVSRSGVTMAFGLALVVGMSTTLIGISGFHLRMLVAFAVFLYTIASIMLFVAISALMSSHKSLLVAFVLVVPSIVSEILFGLGNPSITRSPFFLTIGQLAGFGCAIALGYRPRLPSSAPLAWRDITRSLALSVSLFCVLAAIQVPVGFNGSEKLDYMNHTVGSRAPLFAVATLILILSPVLAYESQSRVLRIVAHRRVALFATLVGCAGLVAGIISAEFETGDRLGSSLFWWSCASAFLLAVEIPWITLRMADRRGQGRNSVVGIACSLLVVSIPYSSAVSWQITSVFVLVTAVAVEVWQHWSRSSPLLKSVRAENSAPHYSTSRLSVVIPSYNPGPAISQTLESVRAALSDAGCTYELIVVSDGSSDGTAEFLDQSGLADKHVWLRSNHGKGGALREGFALATGDVVAFIDADGDINPSALPSMADLVSSGRFDVVYGSKLHPESNVRMSAPRIAVSTAFRLLVRVLFRIDVRDTQSGIKAFNGEFLRGALPLLRESGFNLDLELFVLGSQMGYTRFAEHPILLDRKGESTVRFSTLFSMFWSTISMYWRVHLALEYSELIETRLS